MDLSKAAARKAAKRCSSAEIAVSSVYRLPIPAASVDLLINCFSPLATGEFARVLKPGGHFLYVVPGPKHLWELKSILYDEPYENEEKRETYPGFHLMEVEPVEMSFTLRAAERDTIPPHCARPCSVSADGLREWTCRKRPPEKRQSAVPQRKLP